MEGIDPHMAELLTQRVAYAAEAKDQSDLEGPVEELLSCALSLPYARFLLDRILDLPFPAIENVTGELHLQATLLFWKQQHGEYPTRELVEPTVLLASLGDTDEIRANLKEFHKVWHRRLHCMYVMPDCPYPVEPWIVENEGHLLRTTVGCGRDIGPLMTFEEYRQFNNWSQTEVAKMMLN